MGQFALQRPWTANAPGRATNKAYLMSGKSYAERNLYPVGGCWNGNRRFSATDCLRSLIIGTILLSRCGLWPASGQSPNDFAPRRTLPPEVWQVIRDGDTSVGYSVVRWHDTTIDHAKAAKQETSESRLIWTQETNLTIRRADLISTQQIYLTSVERPDGTVDEFSSQHIDGAQTTTLRGVRDGDRFELQLDGDRPTDEVILSNARSLKGFFALEQSLAADPLQPGDQRQWQCLFPLSTQPAKITVVAGQIASTKLLHDHKHARLLRVTGQIRLNEHTVFDFDCWQDEEGRIRKMHVPATHQTTFTCTREDALAESPRVDAELPDLVDASLVRATSVSGNPHLADRVQYVIRAQRGSLQGRFATSTRQTVTSRTDGSVRIRIRTKPRHAPGQEGMAIDPSSPSPTSPNSEYLRPNPWIESDDELIQRMSDAVACDSSNPLLVARALAAHVHTWLEHKDYGRSWDSAAAAARNRRGDCTEHAALTAALCRARGIPTRIAFGLLFLNSRESFGGHAWTEAWIDGQWIGLDATRNALDVGGGYIKVGDSSLSATTAQVAMLPLTQVLSQGLSIEIVTKPAADEPRQTRQESEPRP